MLNDVDLEVEGAADWRTVWMPYQYEI